MHGLTRDQQWIQADAASSTTRTTPEWTPPWQTEAISWAVEPLLARTCRVKKNLLWITWPRDDGKISSVTVGEPYFVCLSVRKDQQSPLEAIWVAFMEPPARFKSHEICPSSRWWHRGYTARLEIRASIGWYTRLIILFTDFTIQTEGPIITSLYQSSIRVLRQINGSRSIKDLADGT